LSSFKLVNIKYYDKNDTDFWEDWELDSFWGLGGKEFIMILKELGRVDWKV
jgi:hypothetical protein